MIEQILFELLLAKVKFVYLLLIYAGYINDENNKHTEYPN